MKHVGSGSINLLGTTEEAPVERTRSRVGSRVAEIYLHEGSTVVDTGAFESRSQIARNGTKNPDMERCPPPFFGVILIFAPLPTLMFPGNEANSK